MRALYFSVLLSKNFLPHIIDLFRRTLDAATYEFETIPPDEHIAETFEDVFPVEVAREVVVKR